MFVFFLEQMVLILAAFALNVEPRAQLTIGIFALIVLTTATFEKFLLENKYDYLKTEANTISNENEKIIHYLKEVSVAYETLYSKYKKLKQKR